MLKKLTVVSFIVSFILFVVSLCIIPFVAKSEVMSILNTANTHYINENFSIPLTDEKTIVFDTNDRGHVRVYRSPYATDITVIVDGFYFADVDFIAETIDDRLFINRVLSQKETTIMSKMISNVFSYELSGISVVIPSHLQFAVEGRTIANDIDSNGWRVPLNSLCTDPEVAAEFRASEAGIRAELEASESEMRMEFDEAKAELDASESEMRMEFDEAKAELDASETEMRMELDEAKAELDFSESEMRMELEQAEAEHYAAVEEIRIEHEHAEAELRDELDNALRELETVKQAVANAG